MMGDPDSLTFHKVIFAPIFLLAVKGLRHFFPEELDESRSIATYVEFHILQSGLLAGFVLFVAMPQSIDLKQQITAFFGMVLIMAGCNTLLLIRGRRTARKQN